MKIRENWYVDAPWAQLLCSTKMPDDTLQKFISLSDEVMNESESQNNIVYDNGRAPDTWNVELEKYSKYDVHNYIMETAGDYMKTILSNGSIKQHMDVAVSDGPHTEWNTKIISSWVVSLKEGKYLPIHAHSKKENGYEHLKISGVMYLKTPKRVERSPDGTIFDAREGGQITFTGMGSADQIQTTSLYNVQPEAGWLYIFPSTLNHQVHPFTGEGERRSLSFNIDFISTEQLDKIKRLNTPSYTVNTEEPDRSKGYEVKI